MDNITRISDGHAQVFGMDGSTEPAFLDDAFVSKAVNRTFRGGINSTRPKFIEPRIFFEDDNDLVRADWEDAFARGNVQGVFPYFKTARNRDPGLVVAIGGRLFFGKVVADSLRFRVIYEGLDAEVLNVWAAQGQEVMYFQNGVDNPVGWNGVGDAWEVTGDNKMPVATCIGYSHGRMIVADDKNNIAISDHLYATSDRRGMENFTENTDYRGGTFSTPTQLGEIVWIGGFPTSNSRSGISDTIYMCENGAAAQNISGDRAAWIDPQLIFHGAGGVGPWSITPINNDIWYRRPDGVGSLRVSRTDEMQQWSDTPLSREVDNWLSHDTPHLLRYCNLVYFDNRLLCSTYPQKTISSDGYGSDRYSNGLVVLDFHKGSSVNPDPGFGWDGLWTGVRPAGMTVVFAEGVNRCFIMSYDKDNRNRLYELKTTFGDDLGTKKIRSSYVTKAFHSFGKQSSMFQRKKLTGGGRIHSVVRNSAKIRGLFRTDHYPEWSSFMKEVQIGEQFCKPLTENGCKPVMPLGYYCTLRAEGPNHEECEQGSGRVIGTGYAHQIRMEMEGSVAIPWMSIMARDAQDTDTATCSDGQCPEAMNPVITCPDKDFDYLLIEEDTDNAE